MPIEPKLPNEAFEKAMRMHLEVTEQRIHRLYVRPRALFAESIVAALVDGTVVEFPAAAWDVEMPLAARTRPVRIQVKCSGERAPHSPKKILPPVWGRLKEPKSAKAPDLAVLQPGFQCDVFVFARHEGEDIERGWHFYVLSQNAVKSAVADHPFVDLPRLLGLGAVSCEPIDLKERVVEVVRQGSRQRTR